MSPILVAMPQSLSYLLTHIVFSTKDRAPVLEAAVRPALYADLATVARNADCECFRVGGVADPAHLAIRLARTLTLAKLIEELKTSSSKWLKTQSPALASSKQEIMKISSGHMRFGLKARNMIAQGGASPRAKPWVSRPDHDFQALKGRNIEKGSAHSMHGWFMPRKRRSVKSPCPARDSRH